MTSTIDGLISKKEYEAAYARLQALLAKSPEDPTLIERLGNCCYLWGLGLFWGEKRYDEGLTRCREAAAAYEALGSRPVRRGKGREPASESAARCRCMEGVNLSALGDHAQAAETLESVSNSRNETGARAARARGIALTRLGQWKEADACFATAAKWYARRPYAPEVLELALSRLVIKLQSDPEGPFYDTLKMELAKLRPGRHNGKFIAHAYEILAQADLARDNPRSALAQLKKGTEWLSREEAQHRMWMRSLEGRAFEALGEPVKAMEAYHLAAEQAEEARDKLAQEEFRLTFHESRLEIHIAFVRLLLERNCLPEAFLAGQRLKARSLLERLGESGAGVGTLAGRPLKAEEVAKLLKEDDVLLDFYILKDQVWMIRLTRAELTAKKLDLAPATVADVSAILKGFYAQSMAGITATGEALHGYLAWLGSKLLDLPPRDGPKGKLRIVPQDAFYQWPWTAIGGEVGFESTAVLMSTGLVQGSKEPRDRTRKDVVIFADSLGDLPHARDEAREISLQYPGARIYQGEEASADRFRHEAPLASGLHVACHGVYDASSPMDSAILFSDGVASARFTARDVEKLKFKDCEWVTLTACHAGAGARAVGEEWLGLARSFLYAGAGCVRVPLWEVPDEPVRLVPDPYITLEARA